MYAEVILHYIFLRSSFLSQAIKPLIFSKGRFLRFRCMCAWKLLYDVLYDAYGPVVGWEKRYHFWYERALLFDTFPIRTSMCPLPFDPENKIAQKAFANYLSIPTTKTIANLNSGLLLEDVCSTLTFYVAKPAFGGMSSGLLCVIDGLVADTGNPPDFTSKRKEALEYISRFGSSKQDFWLVEELCRDEIGCNPMRDFKFFVHSGDILAVQIMSDVQNCSSRSWPPYTYISATVDENFDLMEPWNTEENPFVRELVRNPASLTQKPACWREMVQFAKQLGTYLNIFCRVDFFATTDGAMFCELETLMNYRMISKEAAIKIKYSW
eukprot:CAMPEP_0183821126 /NCGR_PEP_ID=MMETSP0803_2-20130417/64985_1 /TAXON_ID=195967 /ORGANISM="Crustomastix stigmata, Strain CCMP3273" /LENGTH=323 /DNA_ID=CAMNT_0026066023 /DNA_START=76 /DNA_END=1047 /DNA_ORIENTATION=+